MSELKRKFEEFFHYNYVNLSNVRDFIDEIDLDYILEKRSDSKQCEKGYDNANKTQQ